MRNKRLILSLLLLLGLGLTGLQAQTMYVKESNGMQTAYALSSLQKMTFSGGNVTIQKTENTTGVYVLNGLMYLNFLDISTSSDEPRLVQNQMLKAYPNPAGDILNIDFTGIAQQEGMVSILNFEGKILLNRQISNAEVYTLNISHLPNGMYFCRYVNATEIKTVKIIKQ